MHPGVSVAKDEPLDPYPSLFAKGVKEYESRNIDSAIAIFQKISKAVFGHEPSLYNLGLCYIQKEKYSEALKAFQDAALFNPYNLFSQKYVADLALILKKDKEAENGLKTIIERNPQDTEAHFKIGLLALRNNNLDAAVNEFTIVRNLNPQDAFSSFNLVGLFLQKGDLVKAQTSMDEARTKEITDKKLDAFHWALRSFMHQKANEAKEAQEAIVMAQGIAPDWKTLKESPLPLAKIQLELANFQINIAARSNFSNVAPFDDYQQSEVAQRTVERIKKEKESPGRLRSTKTTTKKPLNLSGELNQTVEYYNRDPATSSPINNLNTVTNLKLEGNEKGIYLKNEFEWFHNRWDHTQLDYFKTNIKNNKNDEVDLGKFSAKNFPDLISHPTIEQGGRWVHKIELPPLKGADASGLPQDLSGFADGKGSGKIPSLSKIYSQKYLDRRMFKTTEITVVYGRSKKPINIDNRKLKNDRTYETSGQYEQWVQALHVMTKPTDITELGFSYSRVKDAEKSATVSPTTVPIESEAMGLDGKVDLIDGKLKLNGEYALGNYDPNIFAAEDIKKDKAFAGGVNYRPNSNWEFAFDQKTIGKNFKVEGAYQTEDKTTQTWTTKYSATKNTPWSIRSVDIKYEPAWTNILKRGDNTATHYKTAEPKVSFNLPQDAKLSVDYKWYSEASSCNCSRYKTNTVKTDLDYECKPIKTTFRPSYTFERKDDLVTSPTDELKKDYGISLENRSVKNLTLKMSFDKEMKNYVGASTKSYSNYKYAFETRYAFIPNRFETAFKVSTDNKDQTDTNDIELDTMDGTAEYSSKDGNTKFSFEWEHKSNIYRPWDLSSAYRQTYYKFKWTQRF